MINIKTKIEAYLKEDAEEISNYMYGKGDNLSQYMDNKTIGLWKLDTDRSGMVGTWIWYRKGSDGANLAATPFWDGAKNIPIAFTRSEEIETTEIDLRPASFKFTYDKKKDGDAYVEIIGKYINQIEKIIQF